MLTDRIGTGLLLASVVGVVAAGWRAPTVVSETEDTERNAQAFRQLVLHPEPRADTKSRDREHRAPEREYFRTCIARDDRERFFCAFIDTSGGDPRSTFRTAPQRVRAA